MDENKDLEISEDNEENTKKDKKFSILKEIWEWIYTIAIAVVIALVIKAFLFDVVKVDGSSMFPTLHNNDRLIVTKLLYEPEQGDIVILDSSYKKREMYYDQLAKEKDKDSLNFFEKLIAKSDMPDFLKEIYYVKRIIALPGQTVDLTGDGKVYVDGKALDEEYYDGMTMPTDSNVNYPVTVKDGTVFVMGDNRMHSKDSRSADLGLVPIDAIIGKSQLRIWPLNTISLTR